MGEWPYDFREHIEKGKSIILPRLAKIPSIGRRQDCFIINFGCNFKCPKKIR
jgi:hypothetical protein